MRHKITEKIVETYIIVYFHDEEIVKKLLNLVNWEPQNRSTRIDDGTAGKLVINIEDNKYSNNIIFFINKKDSIETYHLRYDSPAKRAVISFILPYLSARTRTTILLHLEDQE